MRSAPGRAWRNSMNHRVVLCVASGLLLLTNAPPVGAHVDVDVHIGVPAPPVIAFPGPPQAVIVPQTQVYYVPDTPDYDMYRAGPYWYVNRDGYWYRSRRYNGPFAVVQYERVPHQIIVLPGEYHRHPLHPHGGPPG